MPTYSHKCDKCGIFDVFARMSEHQTTEKCPTCGADGPQVYVVAPLAGGLGYSDATRKLLEAPFGRERAQSIRDGKDLDRQLSNFAKRYPHLGKPQLNKEPE